jgi:hypothetical protein
LVRIEEAVKVEGPAWESWEKGEREASWSRRLSRLAIVKLDFWPFGS